MKTVFCLLVCYLTACLWNLLHAFILVSSLNFISFYTCFSNAYLSAHLIPTLFPLPIQRTHSTTINEPKQTVILNKPVSIYRKCSFQSKTSKQTKETPKMTQKPQQKFSKHGINSSCVTAHSSDQLKDKFKYLCHLPQFKCAPKMQDAVHIF